MKSEMIGLQLTFADGILTVTKRESHMRVIGFPPFERRNWRTTTSQTGYFSGITKEELDHALCKLGYLPTNSIEHD